jgi:hypothetical protein
LRNHDFSHSTRDHFELFADLSDRDRTGVQKTFSGLMKILYPHRGEATVAEIEELLKFAIEGLPAREGPIDASRPHLTLRFILAISVATAANRPSRPLRKNCTRAIWWLSQRRGRWKRRMLSCGQSDLRQGRPHPWPTGRSQGT